MKLPHTNLRIMTVDVERDLRSEKSLGVEIIVPKLLDFFKEEKIKATFFTVTSLLEKHESIIKEIARKQEVASHSHTHSLLSSQNAEFEINTSMQKMKEYGLKCSGFRAPEFVFKKNYLDILQKYGYSYDSSLAKCFPGRYLHLNSPPRPFIDKNILEFPVPTFIYPSVNAGLPYLKLLHPLSKLFSQRYLFYLHPWEFLEKKDLTKTDSLGKFLLKRNCGKKAWNIFKNFLHKEESTWIGCGEWKEKMRIEKEEK